MKQIDIYVTLFHKMLLKIKYNMNVHGHISCDF